MSVRVSISILIDATKAKAGEEAGGGDSSAGVGVCAGGGDETSEVVVRGYLLLVCWVDMLLVVGFVVSIPRGAGIADAAGDGGHLRADA